MSPLQPAHVLSVARSATHTFSKACENTISLEAGRGVVGDAHRGTTVKHRSRVRKDPTQPNLRQVHLIHAELLAELEERGFRVRPGDLGENILTIGIDLLALPQGTRLRIGEDAVIEITGLRNPCKQIDDFQSGLMSAVLGRDGEGRLIRKSGVMAVVAHGGLVEIGDAIRIEKPAGACRPLEPV